MRFVNLQQLLDLLVAQLDNREISFYALLLDALREHSRVRSVSLQRDEDVRWMDAVLIRDLLDYLVLQQRRVIGSERGIRGEDDALLRAELDDVVLRARGVQFYLVDGGNNLAVGEEPLEELDGKV